MSVLSENKGLGKTPGLNGGNRTGHNLSDQHYKKRLSLRIFKRWEVKLSAVDGLEDVADEVQHARAEHAVERYWTRWRQMTHLRAAESVIAQQVGQRVKRQVMKTWRKQM